MEERAVVVVGGGPTGLVLAAELALAGTDVVVVERRPDQELDGSRAGGLLPRTLEVLEQRGVADRFVAAGTVAPRQGFGGTFLDIGDLPSRHNHVLALWQRDVERILADWVDELGVDVRHGREVVGIVPDDGGVDVVLSDGHRVRAGYVVGCDGGRSLVRRQVGIDFPGWPATTSWIIAEVAMADPELGMRREGGGIGPVEPGDDGGPYRVVLVEGQVGGEVGHTGPATLEDLRRALVDAYGTDFAVHDPTWVSRFTDSGRQAATYRRGRVLLAGDAAHVHPPHGGQGLNTGVQDAVNLGWKLALVVAGTAPDHLLDTYHDERHPVGARAIRTALAQVALTVPDERHELLRDLVGEVLAMDQPRAHVATVLNGLAVHYDLGDGHPLLGRRMPDLDLQTSGGPRRTSTLLHRARPVLLDLGATSGVDVGPWTDRVDVVHATCDGPWDLPVVGEVAAPTAVLVRPDGHVAWVGDRADDTLEDALATWFGPAA